MTNFLTTMRLFSTHDTYHGLATNIMEASVAVFLGSGFHEVSLLSFPFFAVNGIAVMALQSASRARESYLVRGQQRAGEIEEQGHAENHDDDRDHAARRSRKGDVAKAGRRQRRHRKIQRVRIVRDLGIAELLRLVNDGGHHEDEHCEVGDREDDFLIAPEERAVFAQPSQHPVVAQQPQRSQNPQEAAGFAGKRRKK